MNVTFSASGTPSCARSTIATTSSSCALPRRCWSTPTSKTRPLRPRSFRLSMNWGSSILPAGLSCSRYLNPLILGQTPSPPSLSHVSRTALMYLSSASGPAGSGAQGMIPRHSEASFSSWPSPSRGRPPAILASHDTSASGCFHPPSGVGSDSSFLRSVSRKTKPERRSCCGAVAARYSEMECCL